MKAFRNQRWNILQRMVYVVRNFKSIVYTAVSHNNYQARSIASNSASDFEVTLEEDGRQYSYYPDCREYKAENNQNKYEAYYYSRNCRSCTYENFDKSESTSSNSSNDRIGDIVGISTR